MKEFGFTLMAKPRQHKGFTLAEVLITLGIIGVVAALTIPTLVHNYQNKAWATASTVFERKLEEALKTMNTQQTLAGHQNTLDFVNELSKHFKINKICNNNEITSCFEDKITWQIIDLEKGTDTETIDISGIKTAADLGQQDWDSETIGIQFANGTSGIIAYNPECEQDPYSNLTTGLGCISLVYDTDGFKNPNTFNKDVRGINSFLKECAFKSGSTCFSTPFKPEALTNAECEEKKGELGLTYCFPGDDYFAAAVKQCKDEGKRLPSRSELKKIASYIYNTDVAESGYTYETRDDDKASKLGFKFSSGLNFYLWSGQEHSTNSAYHWNFFPSATFWNYDFRNDIRCQAVCVGD